MLVLEKNSNFLAYNVKRWYRCESMLVRAQECSCISIEDSDPFQETCIMFFVKNDLDPD